MQENALESTGGAYNDPLTHSWWGGPDQEPRWLKDPCGLMSDYFNHLFSINFCDIAFGPFNQAADLIFHNPDQADLLPGHRPLPAKTTIAADIWPRLGLRCGVKVINDR